MSLSEQICNNFSRQAVAYDKHALMQREVGERMLARLSYFNIQPKRVLDLGCGTGYLTTQLQLIYPGAHVIGLDFSQSMLDANQSPAAYDKLCANMVALPFEDAVFDLIFANQVIHWVDYPVLFQEMYRVLMPGGCFFFSTLGPDSLRELRLAWEKVDGFPHTHAFPDMHDLGDVLMQHHFLNPVIDRDDLSIHYASLSALLSALKHQGISNIHPARNRGLTTPRTYQKLEAAYAVWTTEEGLLPLSYEIVQGHAWKGQQHVGKQGTEVHIPVSDLTNRSR